MTLLLQASGRGGGRMILSGMLTYPRGQCPCGAFSWASSMAQLVGGMSTARDRETGR